MTAPDLSSPRADAPPAVLRLRGVTKRWPGLERPVLHDADLDLAPGTATVLTGRNGAGKTTLLRIAAGLFLPDAGHVELDGAPLDRDPGAWRARLGFLAAATSGLYARLTVREHLDYWSKLALMPRAQRVPAIERAIDRLQLHEFADRRVDRISMGQRQRARLALTVLHDPDVLLLDEPRTSLDREGTEVLVGLVDEVRTGGGAVLWCAPDGEPQDWDLDRHLELHEGRIAEVARA